MAEIPPPPGAEGDILRAELRGDEYGYLAGTSSGDFLARPIHAPSDILAQFPPTLLLSATRAFDLSDVLALHRALSGVEVETALHVFDGLGHCFYYNAWLPEARDAYAAVLRFFDRHLRQRSI